MEIITKRVDDTTDSAVYLKVVWLDNDTDLFHIQVVGPEKSWSGRYSQESALEDSKRIDEDDLDNYKLCVKKALTFAAAPTEYKFFISKDTEKTFMWKKMYNQKLIQHGSIPIHPDDPPLTSTDFIDNLISTNNILQGTVSQYSNTIKTLNEEIDKVQDEMKKFICMKTNLETSLYGKFVELLNAKKTRIRELEKHVGNISDLDNEEMQ